MKILITGHKGLIGSAIKKKLELEGHFVTVLSPINILLFGIFKTRL